MQTSEQPSAAAGSAWWRAVTLAEREALAGSEVLRNWAADPATAAHRLAQWRALPTFKDPAFLTRRLERTGLDVSRFERLLGATPEKLTGAWHARPEWSAELEAILEQFAKTAAAGGNDGASIMTAGFAPFFEAAEARLRNELQRRGVVPPVQPDTLAPIFLPTLVSRFAAAVTRTMVLEVNVARLRGQLDGDTPDERFRRFVVLLREPDFFRSLLEEYSVLARCLMTILDQWVVHTTEILERLASDWDALRGTLLPHDTEHLVSLAGDAGDTHRDGRAVCILHFDNGAKLVYKPRSLAVDVHYNQLLDWLNARGLSPRMEGVDVIDRHTYGWARYMEATGCADEAALRRFYQRQGSLLALLYALEATDVHHENLIAAGEHPILIDLESLFQQRSRRGPSKEGGAGDAFAQSVMRIGLLPQRIWSFDERETGIDISGMSGEAGQLTPFTVLTYENVGTDQMKAVRKRMRLMGGRNLPTVSGQAPRLEEHVDEIVSGFQAMYRLIVEHRDALLESDGPLAAFANDEIRTVLRNTRTYGMLLGESFHPDVLRDAIDRSRLFERLWDRARFDEQLFAVVPAEIRELERGDIPMFTSRPNCRHLWSSSGELFADYFDATSHEAVRARIATLDDSDLQRQTWFITASIASLTLGVESSSVPPSTIAPAELTKPLIENAVRAIADRIDTLAVRAEDDVNWIGLTLIGGRQWTLLPLAYDLYNGTLGPMLFLAYAGDRLREPRYSDLARIAMDAVLRRLATIRDEDAALRLPSIGGYAGPGSLVHALTLAGQLFHDDRALAAAERLLHFVAQRIPHDDSFDVINGSAGAILNTLTLWRATGSPAALDVARIAGDLLVSKAVAMPRGLAWSSRYGQSQPLAGFSHGASGIAHALLSLAKVTGDERYVNVAKGALEYEQSVFSHEHRNWPDFRVEGDDPPPAGSLRFMTAWCHGAPGVGLARLTAAALLGEPYVADDLDAAIATTLAGFAGSDSLCHGGIGNAEFLDRAARLRGDAELQRRVETNLAATATRIAAGSWYCGTPRATETPGLMSGLAGIGYGLLRFFDRDLPSLLTLDEAAEVRA
ncbi:MAG TPA: type 2 lanthipeptide synthetase LanM family protein [Thermoanaerobaculia bacterium]|nr:type 2 lanthipeptide synthetase LanM family protein [Thermoanaerobaculia bacterium]